MSFIGEKKIKDTKTLEEKTPGGTDIIEVTYVDNKKEVFSKLMYDKVVSEKSCDLTTLRDRRMRPVVEMLLFTLREWGVKMSETGYMGSLLNASLNANNDEAIKSLWRTWLPTINSLDDIDTITVDRVLKAKKENPVISPYNEQGGNT